MANFTNCAIIHFIHMNTHCYTMVPGDASLVMVIQDRTHHKFRLFASHCENSKAPLLCFLLHIYQRGKLATPETQWYQLELHYQASHSSDSQFQGTRTAMKIESCHDAISSQPKRFSNFQKLPISLTISSSLVYISEIGKIKFSGPPNGIFLYT